MTTSKTTKTTKTTKAAKSTKAGRPAFLPLAEPCGLGHPKRLRTAPPEELYDSYEQYEQYEAEHGPEQGRGRPRVICDGLTLAQAHAFLSAAYARVSRHPRLDSLMSDGNLVIAWLRDAGFTPAKSIGFVVQLWAVTTDKERWSIVDKGSDYGRFPWLSGWGWLPEKA